MSPFFTAAEQVYLVMGISSADLAHSILVKDVMYGCGFCFLAVSVAFNARSFAFRSLLASARLIAGGVRVLLACLHTKLWKRGEV